METIKKILPTLFIVIIIGGIGVAVALNWKTIDGLINGTEKKEVNLSGQTIDINVGGSIYIVPPVFNEKVLSYLSKELDERGGLPVQAERRGNALPFGIPL